MGPDPPDVYCFFQELEPREPLIARFDRDYLLHAVSGALQVAVDGTRWSLPPSFAAWVPAETQLTVTLERRVTSCSILARPGLGHGMPNHPAAFQMTRMTRDMAWHCRDWTKEAEHPPEAPVFFAALLSTCARLISTSVNVARPTADDPALSRAIAYTEAHLDKAVSAQVVATNSGMSERTMQRRFLAELGASWGQVLTKIRMIRAIELLAQEKMPIVQIAIACGYSSLSAFNRNFKEYAGQTPSEFRKKLK